MDSGFCDFRGIVELAKRGVYVSAVTKKRQYWPKYIWGDDVKEYFKEKNIGDIDALPGMFDDIIFHSSFIKEEDCVMMLMSSYVTMGKKSETTCSIEDGKKKVTFKYSEVTDNHFKGRHAVDDNNEQRLQDIPLEETWYAFEFFGQNPQENAIKFHQKLAKNLIYNKWVPKSEQEEEKGKRPVHKKMKIDQCQLVTLPPCS
eukprot:1676001-Ditylum_brightwellii.AAC.1